MKIGVFIERDVLLNQARLNGQNPVTPTSLAQFQIKEEASALITQLKSAGLMIFITTHQPGISRGYLSRRELDRMHDQLRRALPIDDLFLCAHDESDSCPCRRPKPGLLKEAKYKWQLNLDHSFVISDKWQDAEAARAASCTSLLIDSPWIGSVHHDFVLPSLAVVVEKILQLRSAKPVEAV